MQKPFKPVKYFSIDRVFRNETLDATHLAEFHQVSQWVREDEGWGKEVERSREVERERERSRERSRENAHTHAHTHTRINTH